MFNNKKKLKQAYAWLIGINFLALLDSAYLIYIHYKPSDSASEFCTFGESFNCDIVNKSPFAEFLDVPVAIWGFATYLLLLGISIYGFKSGAQKLKKLLPYIFAFVSFGLLFALRLTYIEAFILQSWCIYCVIQQILILIQWGIWGRILQNSKKGLFN
jgi:vitamin-K-epoxide reductase (warfarin-sensitive)